MKTAKDYLQEANEVVKKIDVKEAIEKHKSNSSIFIDVRDSSDIKKTGNSKKDWEDFWYNEDTGDCDKGRSAGDD